MFHNPYEKNALIYINEIKKLKPNTNINDAYSEFEKLHNKNAQYNADALRKNYDRAWKAYFNPGRIGDLGYWKKSVCTATIVSFYSSKEKKTGKTVYNYWLLTAGHCVYKPNKLGTRQSSREMYFVRINDAKNEKLVGINDQKVSLKPNEFRRCFLSLDGYAKSKEKLDMTDVKELGLDVKRWVSHFHNLYDYAANDMAILWFQTKKALPYITHSWSVAVRPFTKKDPYLMYLTYDFNVKTQNQMIQNLGKDFNPSNANNDNNKKDKVKESRWHQPSPNDERVWIVDRFKPYSIKDGMSGSILYNYKSKKGYIVGILSCVFNSDIEVRPHNVAGRFNEENIQILRIYAGGKLPMARWRYELTRSNPHISDSYFGDFHFDAHAKYVQDGMDILYKDLILLDVILMFGCIGCLCLSIGMVFGYLIHFIEKTRKFRI